VLLPYQKKKSKEKIGSVYIFIDMDVNILVIENSKYQQNNSSEL
jgi:hypothetical protein